MISPFRCVAELPVMMMIIADSWSMAELYSLELMIGGYLEVLLQSKFQENNIWQIAKWPWVNNNFQGLVWEQLSTGGDYIYGMHLPWRDFLSLIFLQTPDLASDQCYLKAPLSIRP